MKHGFDLQCSREHKSYARDCVRYQLSTWFQKIVDDNDRQRPAADTYHTFYTSVALASIIVTVWAKRCWNCEVVVATVEVEYKRVLGIARVT